MLQLLRHAGCQDRVVETMAMAIPRLKENNLLKVHEAVPLDLEKHSAHVLLRTHRCNNCNNRNFKVNLDEAT